jgi:hypothetical protein
MAVFRARRTFSQIRQDDLLEGWSLDTPLCLVNGKFDTYEE